VNQAIAHIPRGNAETETEASAFSHAIIFRVGLVPEPGWTREWPIEPALFNTSPCRKRPQRCREDIPAEKGGNVAGGTNESLKEKATDSTTTRVPSARSWRGQCDSRGALSCIIPPMQLLGLIPEQTFIMAFDMGSTRPIQQVLRLARDAVPNPFRLSPAYDKRLTT